MSPACRRGHEFTEANTRMDRRGRRICRECGRTRIAEWRQSRRAAALERARAVTISAQAVVRSILEPAPEIVPAATCEDCYGAGYDASGYRCECTEHEIGGQS